MQPIMHEFQLILDRIPLSFKQQGSDEAPRKPVPVPESPCYLYFTPEGELQLAALPAGDVDHALLIEPQLAGKQPGLVVISPDENTTRVNGQNVPRFAILRDGDQLQPDDAHVLHVALLLRPWIGPVPTESVGRECPICRLKLVEGVRVYVCPQCKSAMHLQSDETPEEDRLECAASVSCCPACQTKIEMEPGFRTQPELYSA